MPSRAEPSSPVNILTVSELTRFVQSVLQTTCGECWVVGEVSNLRTPQSGHVYFSLKDESAQIAAVMFRSARARLPFQLQDGTEVIARGRVDLYPVRGALQFYVDALEPRGLGALQLALEQLKRRLAAEGLFAEERKRPLPFLPRAVGIVTALGGAAIHDMLVTLQTRWPGVRAVIRPVRVQGDGAAPDIVAAIADLQEVAGVDVLLVGRGGGSIEDLWAFNDERVARAIAGSSIPVVSAVGHEIDITIAALVADRRAATPTAAAALAVPDRHELDDRVRTAAGALQSACRRVIQRRAERLDGLVRHLRDPRQIVRTLQLRTDDLGERAARAIATTLRLARQQVRAAGERLQALSPLAVLDRGFSIVRRERDGTIVRDAALLEAGESLRIRFAHGRARVRVEEPESD